MHRRIAAFMLIIASVLLATLPPASPIHAAGGWTIEKVVIPGDGFIAVTKGRIGVEGTVVVHAFRNQTQGFYRVRGGVTAVAERGVALPGNLGTVTDLGDAVVDPQGRIVFTAHVEGGTLPTQAERRAFRWSAGQVTLMQPDDGSTHFVASMNSAGEWLIRRSSGTSSDRTHTFSRTNGVTSAHILTGKTAFNTSACTAEDVYPAFNNRGTLNAAGQALFYRTTVTGSFNTDGCTLRGATHLWELVRVGESTTVITSGATSNTEEGGRNGDDMDEHQFLINDAGDVAYVKDIYKNDKSCIACNPQQLIIRDALGERVLVDTRDSPVARLHLDSFSPTGQVVFSAALDGNTDSGVARDVIFAGADLQNDRVIGVGDSLFGSTLFAFFEVMASAPPASAADMRVILFPYQLADGSSGLALATKGLTRWTNSSGGLWASTDNWSPAEIPGQSTSIGFGLDASYNVTVGTQRAGRVEVTDGSVGFNGAQLTLTGPLEVGGDADLVVPDGSVTAGEVTLGHLPPTNPAQPSLARLAVSNPGSTLTSGGPLRIGVASDAQFDLHSGATATSAETRLGDGSPGTANVRDAGTRWTTGNIAVGHTVTGTLTIEGGAHVNSGLARVGGNTEGLNPTITSTSTVAMRGRDSVWNVAEIISVGVGHSARVVVENGATLNTAALLLGLGDHETEGSLVVRGLDGTRRATLAVATNVRVGFLGAQGSQASLDVSNGALATVGGELSVGLSTDGFVSVGGRDVLRNRATLDVLTLNGACIIGKDGTGELFIFQGGIVRCTDITVGSSVDGSGRISVESFLSESCADEPGSAPTDPGVLDGLTMTIGTHGEVVLDNGLVRVGTTRVGAQGRLLGCGVVEGAVTVESGGTLAPGIRPSEVSAAIGPATVVSAVANTLTISGTLAISPTGVLELDVLGRAPSQYDHVVVTGAAKLDGVLRLNFADGFAPKMGDVFTFVQAGSTTGDFATVEISGLAPGFQFALGSNGSLKALNDGVATTEAASRSVYLPLVRR